jgi:threonine/homoserine/homoserine lactone efflux protein
MLLGAVAFYLADNAIPAVWTYIGGPPATPDRVSVAVFALALCGMAWLTFTAWHMARERAARAVGSSEAGSG